MSVEIDIEVKDLTWSDYLFPALAGNFIFIRFLEKRGLDAV